MSEIAMIRSSCIIGSGVHCRGSPHSVKLKVSEICSNLALADV